MAARSTSSGTPVKSCQQNAGDHERNLFRSFRTRFPVRQRAHVILGDLPSIHVAEDRLEDDADRDRQPRDVADARSLELRQRIELWAAAVAEVEGIEGVEGVVRHFHPLTQNGARGRRRAGPNYIKRFTPIGRSS